MINGNCSTCKSRLLLSAALPRASVSVCPAIWGRFMVSLFIRKSKAAGVLYCALTFAFLHFLTATRVTGIVRFTVTVTQLSLDAAERTEITHCGIRRSVRGLVGPGLENTRTTRNRMRILCPSVLDIDIVFCDDAKLILSFGSGLSASSEIIAPLHCNIVQEKAPAIAPRKRKVLLSYRPCY